MDVAGSRAGSWHNGPLSKSQENPGLQQLSNLGRCPRKETYLSVRLKCCKSVGQRGRLPKKGENAAFVFSFLRPFRVIPPVPTLRQTRQLIRRCVDQQSFRLVHSVHIFGQAQATKSTPPSTAVTSGSTCAGETVGTTGETAKRTACAEHAWAAPSSGYSATTQAAASGASCPTCQAQSTRALSGGTASKTPT